MIEIYTVVRLTAILTGVYACHTTLALLARRERYRRGGLLDYRVVRESIANWHFLRALDPLLSRFTWVLIARLFVGLALVGGAIVGTVPVVLVAVLLATDVLTQARHGGGLSNGFDISVVVDAGLLVAVLFPAGSVGQQAGVLFIAAHGVLGYVVSGIEKLKGEQWRNGTAVLVAFSTASQGNATVFSFLRENRTLCRVVTWATVAFEVLFVLVIVVDAPFTFLFFGAGLVFHATVAVTMRIPGFLFVFPATYPSIAYASQLVPSVV